MQLIWMRFSLFLFSIVLSMDVMACRVENISLEDKNSISTQIYIGRVISVSVPELESIPYPSNITNDFVLTSAVNKQATLVIYKTIKGTGLKRITIPIKWCGGGEVRLGAVAVIYNLHGKWQISHTLDEIKNLESH